MEHLQISFGLVLDLFLLALQHKNFASFILTKIPISIKGLDKHKRFLPTKSQRFFFTRFLHLNIGDSLLESKKHLFAFPGCISLFLSNLHLIHIFNNLPMHSSNQLQLVYHLFHHNNRVIICLKAYTRGLRKLSTFNLGTHLVKTI